jgi:hypothetical protein
MVYVKYCFQFNITFLCTFLSQLHSTPLRLSNLRQVCFEPIMFFRRFNEFLKKISREQKKIVKSRN